MLLHLTPDLGQSFWNDTERNLLGTLILGEMAEQTKTACSKFHHGLLRTGAVTEIMEKAVFVRRRGTTDFRMLYFYYIVEPRIFLTLCHLCGRRKKSKTFAGKILGGTNDYLQYSPCAVYGNSFQFQIIAQGVE